MKGKPEVTLSLTREKLAEARKLTAEMKLAWLEEANNFIHAVKSNKQNKAIIRCFIR